MDGKIGRSANGIVCSILSLTVNGGAGCGDPAYNGAACFFRPAFYKSHLSGLKSALHYAASDSTTLDLHLILLCCSVEQT